MRKMILSILMILLLVVIGVTMSYLRPIKKELTPKKIIPKFTFGKQGKGLGEFSMPFGMVIKESQLYVCDMGNHRIQTLKISPDGSLSAISSFGKQGKGLGELTSPGILAIKEDFLFLIEMGFLEDSLGLPIIENQRIQVLKIKSNGNISTEFIFGKRGESLGEFDTPSSLIIKGDLLYIADTGNHRIQVLELKY